MTALNVSVMSFSRGDILEFEISKGLKSYLLVFGNTPTGAPRVIPLTQTDGKPNRPAVIPGPNCVYAYLHWYPLNGGCWHYQQRKVQKFVG